MRTVALSLFFALLVAIFAVQNAERVTVHFLWWRFPGTSLVIVILASVILGALLVGAVLGIRGRRRSEPPGSAE